jgi:hypothetical protein
MVEHLVGQTGEGWFEVFVQESMEAAAPALKVLVVGRVVAGRVPVEGKVVVVGRVVVVGKVVVVVGRVVVVGKVLVELP